MMKLVMASLEEKQPIDLPLNSLHLRFYIAYETLQIKPFDATNDFLSVDTKAILLTLQEINFEVTCHFRCSRSWGSLVCKARGRVARF